MHACWYQFGAVQQASTAYDVLSLARNSTLFVAQRNTICKVMLYTLLHVLHSQMVVRKRA